MVPTTFESIAKSDIDALIANAVPEGRTIEYKEMLPGGTDKDKKELYESVKRTYDEQTDPRYGAARLWIDKIIDPIETRDAITQALEAAALNPDVPEFGVGVLQT